jgi:hypothetical protein
MNSAAKALMVLAAEYWERAASLAVVSSLPKVVSSLPNKEKVGRLMCGWPPTCKSYFREEHRSLAVMCSAFRCGRT